nr:PREDICTED: cyclin-dependent kinase 2-associated protein 2 isoform X1 [Bos mutus]
MSYKPIAPAPSSTPGSSTPGPGTPVPTGNETTWRPGLPEHLHRPAVCHRRDGQRDPAHLCWQQERHGTPEERHHPCPGPRQRVPGRDRAERPHVTGPDSTSASGPFLATAEHLLLPGLHPELHFPSWASCPVSFGGYPPGTSGVALNSSRQH